jgi:hypothetical protein
VLALLPATSPVSHADYSPLAQSVSAFSDEAVTSKHVLRDSQRIQTGNPPSAPTPSAGDHATAPCGQPSRTDSNLDRTGSGAPVGSAWNPWQGGFVAGAAKKVGGCWSALPHTRCAPACMLLQA